MDWHDSGIPCQRVICCCPWRIVEPILDRETTALPRWFVAASIANKKATAVATETWANGELFLELYHCCGVGVVACFLISTKRIEHMFWSMANYSVAGPLPPHPMVWVVVVGFLVVVVAVVIALVKSCSHSRSGSSNRIMYIYMYTRIYIRIQFMCVRQRLESEKFSLVLSCEKAVVGL